VTLRLLYVSAYCVEYEATLDDGQVRVVTVDVGHGADWLQACRFPHGRTNTGETLGDERLDHEVRVRASEELVRHACAVEQQQDRYAA
jgi:hypothetical protein